MAADAAWWAGADPATLLFANAQQVGLPAASTGYFVDNEFLADDFNKWAELAADPVGVRSLAQATAGDLARSARYRDVFKPLGLGDEIRAVLRVQGSTWGLLCLTARPADCIRAPMPSPSAGLLLISPRDCGSRC